MTQIPFWVPIQQALLESFVERLLLSNNVDDMYNRCIIQSDKIYTTLT
jgi:hypothetical protein